VVGTESLIEVETDKHDNVEVVGSVSLGTVDARESNHAVIAGRGW